MSHRNSLFACSLSVLEEAEHKLSAAGIWDFCCLVILTTKYIISHCYDDDDDDEDDEFYSNLHISTLSFEVITKVFYQCSVKSNIILVTCSHPYSFSTSRSVEMLRFKLIMYIFLHFKIDPVLSVALQWEWEEHCNFQKFPLLMFN